MAITDTSGQSQTSLGLRQHAFGPALLLLIAVNVGGGFLTRDLAPNQGGPLAVWLITLALMVLCLAAIGWMQPINDWRGVLVDQRNKISLSRLQLVLWSIVVVSAVISYGSLNALWGQTHALNLNVPNQLWILLGISTGSFVAAPLVLGTKAANQLDVNKPNGHCWNDIFFGDDTGNNDRVDFSKVQQFFFTIVLVLVYVVSLGSVLMNANPAATGETPVLTFPALDSGFIGLMAISQTAYIAYKALPQNKTDAPA